MSGLTPKQQRFVEEYLVDLNATAAYQRAGYLARNDNVASSSAADLLRNPKVANAISEAQSRRSERTQVTADRVLQEWAILGFADMRHYLRFDAHGSAYLDWSAMPEEATRAISEITQEEFMDGKGENARPVRRTKFKLHDKRGALDSIARHLGMFVDRSESRNLNLNVNMDAQAELRHYTPEQLRALLEAMPVGNDNTE